MRHLPLAALLLSLSASAVVNESPVTLSWQLDGTNSRNRDYTYSFVIKNVSGTTLADDWAIYYNAFSGNSLPLDKQGHIKMSRVFQGYYKLTPDKGFSLAPGDSVVLDFRARGEVRGVSYAPDGAHFAFSGDSMARPLRINVKPLEWNSFRHIPGFPTGELRYAANEEVNPATQSQSGPFSILPALKSVATENGTVDLSSTMCVYADDGLEREAAYASQTLTGTGKKTIGVRLSLMSGADSRNTAGRSNNEYYEITLAADGIAVRGVSKDAVLNGVKTLARLAERNAGSPEVACATICDWPDLHYRGLMLDVVRDYSQLSDVKRLIDRLAIYKINRLQFHLTDDEGWRIEIPGLPELTDVGSRRGMTEKESGFLFQSYAGNGNPDDLSTTSNGYIPKADFVEFLRYAYARGVEVIPEIESPGHARAAIVAMKARRRNLENTDPEAARYFQVWDDDDTSEYKSAQGYNDNVLNPAMEGTYRLMEKVVDEIILMYREAGVPLPYIHMGGDEVPKNPWAKSPAVQRLMAEKGFTTTHEVEEYFITRIADMIAAKGYKIGGWQEAAMRHSDNIDKQLRPHFAAVNCWNTVAEWNGDTIPYSVANNGYPVVLCNVSNFYFDLCYNAHPGEPGLYWGGYVDEFRSWDARPYDIYMSSTKTIDGLPLDMEKQASKLPLLPEAKANIIGVQGQLFSETIRNFDMVEYYILPKIFGLVERGWNTEPLPGQTKAAYNRALSDFELPSLQRAGFCFHVAQPGIKVVKGKVVMNSQYPTAEIRYTIDGSEPTATSALYSKPFATDAKTIRARTFFLGRQSLDSRMER